MSSRSVLLVALALAALPGSAVSQRSKRLVGTYDLEPGLVHSTILPALPHEARRMDGLDLGLHRSVPFVVKLEHGKRAGEFTIVCNPEVGGSRLILPGLVDRNLEYQGRKKRPVRFELHAHGEGLAIQSACASVAKVGGFELAFVDLDHDGALGTFVDGYVVKAPKQKQWICEAGTIDLRQMTRPLEIEGRKHWFEVDRAGFRLIVTDREPAYRELRDEDAQAALELVNELREQLGHEPLALDVELRGPCEQHALYCATNAELTHHQDPTKPSASKAGALASKRSELVYATSTREAVRLCNHTFYHRLNMLSPRLTHIGIGLVHGVAVIDTLSRTNERSFEPFAWPPDRAREVASRWIVGEKPSPLGGAELSCEEARRWGLPISLTFPSAAVTKVQARLFAGALELPAFVSSPEQPGNAALPDNMASILVMARSPLPLGSVIRVEVRCHHAGKPFEKIWSFETRAR